MTTNLLIDLYSCQFVCFVSFVAKQDYHPAQRALTYCLRKPPLKLRNIAASCSTAICFNLTLNTSVDRTHF